MKNILMTIKQFNKKLVRKYGKGMLVAISALILVASIFTVIGVVKAAVATPADPQKITLDTTQALPVISIVDKTEIVPGLANADMDKLNKEHDPAAIKAYIQQLGPQYGVDWKLVYAIGVYESGNYQSSLAQRQNNFFGRKATSSTWQSWDTAQQGIENQYQYMKTHYIDRGLDTPAEINPIYCEGNTWQYKVEAIMNNA